MMRQEAIGLISEDKYLEQERTSEIKSEYFKGEVFAMAGASREHNMIVANLIAALVLQLKKRQCIVYPSDMRLKVEKSGLYTYPDVMVVCDKEKFLDEKEDTLLNPDVIIEVLSDSTEGYDRGEKFLNYRQIDSLKEYVMVWQKKRKIEKYSKANTLVWTLTETDENKQSILLDSIDCKLELIDIYDKIGI